MAEISKKIFKITKESHPLVIKLIENGYYFHFIKVHGNVLRQVNICEGLDKASGEEECFSLILPELLKAGIIYECNGDYNTDYDSLVVDFENNSQLLFQSVGSIIPGIMKRARTTEKKDIYNLNSSYLQLEGDSEEVVKIFSEIIELFRKLQHVKKSNNNIKFELAFALLGIKKD